MEDYVSTSKCRIDVLVMPAIHQFVGEIITQKDGNRSFPVTDREQP